MASIDPQYMLSELRAYQAMWRVAVSIRADTAIEQTIRCSIKNKISAMVVTDDSFTPVGVVSTTDIMGAYYAGTPIDNPVETIMSSPPICCTAEDSLDRVLGIMKEKGIHRVYVHNEDQAVGTGVVSYADIVGLLYRCCHKCERSLRNMAVGGLDSAGLLRVRDVMTHSVSTLDGHATLSEVIEALSTSRSGAILVTWRDQPAGVISKTDLVLAYMHGLPVADTARLIMRTPVCSCDENAELAQAIRQMMFHDTKRLFVYERDPDKIRGVISLIDAAQARSGSCRACIPSRVLVH
jgi:CBS domain-containing protein